MSTSSYDPAGTVRFDFSTGAVSLEGEGRAVLLPERVLTALVGAAGEGGREALRALGASAGEAARRDASPDASPEDALGRAALHVGRLGLGRLSMETWGPALCLQLEGAPEGLEGDSIAAFLEGLLGAMVERDVAVVRAADSYLVVAPGEREAIGARAASARGVAELVAVLSEGGAA